MNFHIWSLPRSGHHAITAWLTSQSKEEKEYWGGANLKYCKRDHYLIRYNKDTLIFDHHQIDFHLKPSDYDLTRQYYTNPCKHFVIANYSGGAVLPKQFAQIKFKNVIMIRDCYNMAASLIHLINPQPHHWEQIPHNINIWKLQAKEALNLTKVLPQKYVILYNKWVTDIDYRKQICTDLKLHFTDKGILNVPAFAGGSSFDGIKYNGHANEMDVNNRYKSFLDNGLFKHYMNDSELVDLNYKLFGIRGPGFLHEYNPWWYKTMVKYGLIKR